MLASIAIVTCIYLGTVAAQQDIICGSKVLAEAPGWFVSPFYPFHYPPNIECEWTITVEPGNIIEIKFDYVDVGDSSDLQREDYLLIYDTSDPTTRIYFGNALDDWLQTSYLSRSNMVTIQFVSVGGSNGTGFNGTYTSRDGNTCDKNSLWGLNIDVDMTRCLGRTADELYRYCFVRCLPGYILKKSSKISCNNGRFFPTYPCDLIAWEVRLCATTNLGYCIYTMEELIDYWSKTDTRETQFDDNTFGEIEVNLDIFPDPGDSSSTDESQLVFVPGRQGGSSAVQQGIETKCFDNLIKYSYCERKKKNNKEYAFSCDAFSKIKKLKKEAKIRKTDACFACRAIDCTSVVYI